MALRQTRRTISVNRQVFELAKLRARANGIPLSQFTEDALRATLSGGREKAYLLELAKLKRRWGMD